MTNTKSPFPGDEDAFTFACEVERAGLSHPFFITASTGATDAQVWDAAAKACGVSLGFNDGVTVFPSGEMEGRTETARLFVGMGV
ncbi:MAG: hypothetical protein JKP96_06640 [Oceanicaulis sp.]|jgi:hypothetical protein|nr:hypothetical protein [Oceanicaulis sp.]